MMIIRVYSAHTSLYGTAKIIIEPLYCHKKDLSFMNHIRSKMNMKLKYIRDNIKIFSRVKGEFNLDMMMLISFDFLYLYRSLLLGHQHDC